jgi:hypothetical protein
MLSILSSQYGAGKSLRAGCPMRLLQLLQPPTHAGRMHGRVAGSHGRALSVLPSLPQRSSTVLYVPVQTRRAATSERARPG